MKKIIAMLTAILMMVSVFGTISAFADNSIPTLGYTNVIAESNFAKGAALASSEYDMQKKEDNTFNEIVSAPYESGKYGDVVEMYPNKDYDNFLRFAYKKINPSYVAANVPDAATKARLNYIKLEMDICFEDLLNGNVQIVDHAGVNQRETDALLKFDNTGKATFLNSVNFDYEADTWYNVTVYMDLKANVYTAYVNDELKAENAKILTDGKANAFIGFGFVLAKQEDSGSAYIDNMKYSAVELPENGGLFMTEMGSGNKRLNYFTKSGKELSKPNAETAKIFNGKSEINSATAATTPAKSIWQMKSGATYNIATEPDKGNVIQFNNNDELAFLMPAYSPYVTEKTTLLTDEEDLAKHQNVVVTVDLCASALGDFTILAVTHTEQTKTDSSKTGSPAFIAFVNDGTIKINDNVVDGVTYEANKWYSFVLALDYVNETFKAWMVDEAGNVTTLTENGTISKAKTYKQLYALAYRVAFSSQEPSCTLKIDDISYYTGSAALSTVAPAYSNKMLIGAAYNGDALASVETATIGSADYDLASVGFASGADKYGMIWDSFRTMVPAIAKTPLN